MFSIGLLSILLASIVLLLHWRFFIKSLPAKEGNAELAKIFITLVSVLMGVGIFFVQQSEVNRSEKNLLLDGVKEEIKVIKEAIKEKIGGSSEAVVCGSGSVTAAISFLPSTKIDQATESILIESYMLRHLLFLSGLLKEHNRWIEIGIDELRNKRDAEILQFQNDLILDVDAKILTQAIMIQQCLETRTSDPDPDCDIPDTYWNALRKRFITSWRQEQYLDVQ